MKTYYAVEMCSRQCRKVWDI